MKPRLEIWKSDQNQEERHFFMQESPNTYVFGYNPKLISHEKAQEILKILLSELNTPEMVNG